ncbi:MAG: DUF2505 family protein [Myxococcales bacterium]|nr:DUF2505 family protein [Myxococcales bacterium]
MSRTYETTVRLAATPARALEIMTSEAFHVARDTVQGAIDVRVVPLERDDARLRYEVHTTRYARGLTGENRSQTESSVTTYEWDLAACTAVWTFAGEHGPRVTVDGTVAIVPDGEGAVVRDTFRVDVKVPLVGGQAERLVISEMKKGFEKYVRVLEEQVAQG